MSILKHLLPWLARHGAMEDVPVPEAAAQKPVAQQPGSGSARSMAYKPHCLLLPHTPDPFGTMAPVLSKEAMRISLSLAETTYSLDITPWLAAGWQDFSFLVDDVLESGGQPYGETAAEVSTPGDAAFQRLASLSRMRRAQSALRARNPFVQLLAALRQREASDTIKAMCMAYPLPAGQHLIAIGFMGTGKRFYDWFSNFRFSDEDGFHQGFSQLCSRFEDEMDNILFPQTAERLGLKSLSLRDVLHSMCSPDSPFRLWMAGHSQGGAVMQVFTHRLLQVYGVEKRFLCGYGFASPTAASASLTQRPWEAPLWHIQNRDDLVPRIGAQMHLGRCVEYVPDAAFRQKAYHYSRLEADEACRHWLEPLLYRIRDTGDNLLHLTALILAITEEKGEDALNLQQDRGRGFLLADRLYAFAGNTTLSAGEALESHLRRMYQELTGHPMDKHRLHVIKDELRPHVAGTPLRRILTCLFSCLTQPHLLNEDDLAQPKAYRLLVQREPLCLRPYRWTVRPGHAAPVRQMATQWWIPGTHCQQAHSRPGAAQRIANGKARLKQHAAKTRP